MNLVARTNIFLDTSPTLFDLKEMEQSHKTSNSAKLYFEVMFAVVDLKVSNFNAVTSSFFRRSRSGRDVGRFAYKSFTLHRGQFAFRRKVDSPTHGKSIHLHTASRFADTLLGYRRKVDSPTHDKLIHLHTSGAFD